MKKLLLIIVLLPFITQSQTHYVSADASGGGKGLTKSDAWTLQEAFSQAKAGNSVYIKAGNYGKKNGAIQNYKQDSNGSSALNMICFIGCDSSWNPVKTPRNRSTYTFDPKTESELNRPFSANDMPYLNTGLQNGESAIGKWGFKDGIGLHIAGDYVRIENITIRGYHIGLWTEGDHGLYKNVNTDFMGNFVEESIEFGMNWYVEGFKNTIKNSFHRDSDMEGIIVTGVGSHHLENIEYRGSGDKNNDDVDYPIVVRSSNNTFKHIKITININANHPQHGFSFKPFASKFISGNGIATNNYVEDLYLENTRLEIQFGGSHHNLVKDVVLVNQSENKEVAYGHTNISIANGAHDNVIMNVVMYRPNYFVLFSDNDDGDNAFSKDEDVSNMGKNNTIINALVIRPFSGVLVFKGHSLKNIQTNANWMPMNFRVFNSTIIGNNETHYSVEEKIFEGYLEEQYGTWGEPNFTERYPKGIATGGFYNCIFKDLARDGFGVKTTETYNNYNAKLSATEFDFKHINNFGGGNDSIYAPYNKSNFTNEPVVFENEMTSYDDAYNYKPKNEIIGADYSTEFATIAAGFSPALSAKFIAAYKNNINNVIRTLPYTVGAY